CYSTAMSTSPASISNYFDLIKLDDRNVKSLPPHLAGIIVPGRTFGGLLVSQAVRSFTTLNPGVFPHTVNYKYIAPGNSSVPLQFKITDYIDSKVASVSASEDGKLVGMGHINYTTSPDLLDSSAFPCPDYGSPDDYSSADELIEYVEGKMKQFLEMMKSFPVEARPVESPHFPTSEIVRNATWLRIKPEFKDDLRSANGLSVALFLSDFTIFEAAKATFEKSNIKIKSSASLHHSVWIHETNFDPLGWYLCVGKCDVISFGRAKMETYMFNESRKCVMTVVQEGYFQIAPERGNKL
ncbi:hypothetical protein PENTCL1PPCAC_16746, partial [Pristionchus entomophagus]